jgi:Zn-dependent protease with chaperone function
MGRGEVLVPSDQCLFDKDRVILAERMRGRLRPDEWKPLLASSLLYQKKIEPRMKRAFLLKFFGPVLIPFVLVFPIAAYVSSQFIRIGYLVFAGLILALVLSNYMRYMQKGRLLADREVSSKLGESLIGVLNKINNLGLVDIETVKGQQGKTSQFGDRPSISQRIQNLRSAPKT